MCGFGAGFGVFGIAVYLRSRVITPDNRNTWLNATWCAVFCHENSVFEKQGTIQVVIMHQVQEM